MGQVIAARVRVYLCVLLCALDVLGASLQRIMVQMDDLNGGVYLFCGAATWGDLLFPGVADFFTLLHIPGTIFHPCTPNPQTDLFSDPASIYIPPFPTHARMLPQTRTLMQVQARNINSPLVKIKDENTRKTHFYIYFPEDI